MKKDILTYREEPSTSEQLKKIAEAKKMNVSEYIRMAVHKQMAEDVYDTKLVTTMTTT